MSDRPLLLWVDDSAVDGMGRDMAKYVWSDPVPKKKPASDLEFDVTLVGSTDEAIEVTLQNRDRIFMFAQDTFRAEGRILPAWMALRPARTPRVGFASHPGAFYTYVIDAYAPLAGAIFAGGYFERRERQLLANWSKRDARIKVLGKPMFGDAARRIAAEQLARWKHDQAGLAPSADSQLISPAGDELAAICGARPGYLDKLTSRQFEEVVASVFRNNGFEVELTARTRDGGYDVVAVSNVGLKNEVALIEVKHFAPTRPVGVGIVRALYGVKKLHNADKAFLVTSSYVSSDAKREFARVIPWELEFAERERVLAWCRKYLASLLEEGSNAREAGG